MESGGVIGGEEGKWGREAPPTSFLILICFSFYLRIPLLSSLSLSPFFLSLTHAFHIKTSDLPLFPFTLNLTWKSQVNLLPPPSLPSFTPAIITPGGRPPPWGWRYYPSNVVTQAGRPRPPGCRKWLHLGHATLGILRHTVRLTVNL